MTQARQSVQFTLPSVTAQGAVSLDLPHLGWADTRIPQSIPGHEMWFSCVSQNLDAKFPCPCTRSAKQVSPILVHVRCCNLSLVIVDLRSARCLGNSWFQLILCSFSCDQGFPDKLFRTSIGETFVH